MIDGVTILNTYEEFIPNPLIVFSLVIFGIIFFALLFYILEVGFSFQNVYGIIAVGAVTIFLFASLIIPYPFGGQIVIHYQVLIDDSVPYNDFISKYKVMNRQGSLYDIVDQEADYENEGEGN